MEDCCAVCAEPLEWLAYGPCGHRDVCSTCVVRLRNVCDDRCCCICKTEWNVVFVTKAMGDYTKTVDFSSLPVDAREGKIGSYWYHEATQVFFDDVDHYRMIKAMCTFSCSVCDKEGHQNDGGRRKANFRSLEQLKGHLSYRHRVMMCKLCLEGRKVFISEQKLYTKAQLNQHISTGDSEVDGTESERGGFAGHPMCEFCRTPFYGDNELYTHMSTEHYTCHFCQRQNPGQFEYFSNYDNLEIHFRQGHFLCEDEGCLAKKFIVFKSEAELKRHNAKEHGGRMSRSQRNAVLQIPTSFRYRRPNESESRRGRGRGFSLRQDSSSSDNQLSMAIQASLETANADPLPSSSSSAQQTFVDEDIDPLIPPFESLAVDSHQRPSRYLQAVSHNYTSGPIQDSSFPPLSAPPNNNQQRQQDGNGLPQNTMATRLRQNNTKSTKVNVAQAWPAANRGQNFPSISSIHPRPMVNNRNASVPGYYSSTDIVTPTGPTSSSYSSSVSWAGSSNSKNPSNNGKIKHSTSASKLGESSSFDTVSDFPPVSSAQTQKSSGSSTQTVGNGLNWAASSISRNTSNNGKMKHSTSASKLSEIGSFDPVSDFPPVSVAQAQNPGGSNARQGVKVEDVQTANKSLVERMQAALANDQNKFAAFKEISQDYRLGSIGTSVYFGHVKKFGLLDLVPDLARLCPDPLKQQELLDTYNSTLRSNSESQDMFRGISKSGKGKKVINAESSSSRSKEALADNVLETVRRLQSNYRHEGEVEVLEKDGYRASKGKEKTAVEERPIQLGTSKQGSSGDGGGGNKKNKKTSKFHRVRLGDGSVGALLDLRNPANDPVQEKGETGDDASGNPGLPVRGVWRAGGGQKLFGSTKK